MNDKGIKLWVLIDTTAVFKIELIFETFIFKSSFEKCLKRLFKHNYSSFPLIQKKITHWPYTKMVVLSQKDPFCYKNDS